MGRNRRYDTELSYRAVAETVIRAEPVSLERAQVGEQVTQATRENKVIAWVPFRSEAIAEIEGRVLAWTERAVLVEFEMKDGRTRRSWVWAGAVRRP
ncbi:hypothetical protein [Herbiconiux sp. L3-i23]|uniref:hypothetical protein n=1 Tax=Herbiconiux sp. L3-i23 TaxID=2905871 RepID=UPI00205E030C|nr:hypothetical protein [Herbiconiux sp. L3-i23]BDI23196.1 hypothetical protein L3i23_19720 [Herbiconiux sp. L3-i23]